MKALRVRRSTPGACWHSRSRKSKRVGTDYPSSGLWHGKPSAASGEPRGQEAHPGGQNENPLRGLNLGQWHRQEGLMRTFIAVAILMVGWGLRVAGQQPQTEKPHNMTGCLQKTPDGKSFMLTVNDKKTVEFTRASADLAPHVGHQIQITGTTDTEREKKEGGQKNGHYMEVTAIKMLAATCS
jgi:hypothetical protein